MALNNINIMGRLTKEPELKITATGKSVLSFTLAVDRDYVDNYGNRECDFINCVAWNGIAEFAAKWFDKGDMACVDGRLQMRRWKDENNNNRTTAEVLVNNMYFCGGKNKKSQTEEDFNPQEYMDQMMQEARDRVNFEGTYTTDTVGF